MMGISVRTVESHVAALLQKLAASGRQDLIKLAQRVCVHPAIPVAVTSFAGREQELAELTNLLAGSRLVCLVGPPGGGKSRLALEAARRWGSQVLVVDLAPAAPGEVRGSLASSLGLGGEDADLAACAGAALAGQDLLLIADNCEHVAGAAAEALGELALRVPGMRILATSRRRLGIPAEHVYPLGPLALPGGTGPGDVAGSAAGTLFLDRARAVAPRFCLDESSAPHVAAICRLLDGLPLAIELAAGRAGMLDPAELAGSLAHGLDLLERPDRAGRHRSLWSAIEGSWRLLRDAERALLTRLAHLPGEFTLALAEASYPDLPAAELRSALVGLLDQSLVSVRLAPAEPASYWLLGVVATFAAKRAGPSRPGRSPRHMPLLQRTDRRCARAPGPTLHGPARPGPGSQQTAPRPSS